MRKSDVNTNHVVIFWFITLIFVIISLIDAFILRHYILYERKLQKDKVELIELEYKLGAASDYLTSEIRSFIVTSDPVYLNNYWNEVEVIQTRNKAVSRLKELHATPEEVGLLSLSKEYSEALVQTEIHAMKLVLTANHIPEDLMPKAVKEFNLSIQDKNLNPQKKMLLAQQLLFGAKYEEAKNRIRSPIQTLRNQLKTRIAKEINSLQNYISVSLNLMILFLTCTLLSIIFLVWFRLSYLLDI